MANMIRNVAAGYCLVLLSTAPPLAQAARASSANTSAPPVYGVVALEDTMKKVYRAANIGLVAARDGLEHAYDLTKGLIVHGGGNRGQVPIAALEGLREGAMVRIRSVNDEDLMETEGRVARIDRSRKRIAVKYDDGTADVLQLAERAAAATWPEDEQAIAAQAVGAEAAVYYNDEDGQRIVHFFKWVR